MAKVKYGMIGFGGIAENRIAKEGFACDKSRFKPLSNAELVAATDLNQGRKAAAEALGLKWYKSAKELLKAPEIQAVFIATNNLSHAALAKEAMKAGKHCLVEKPVATTMRDANALCKMAKEKKLSLGVDHMMTKSSFNVKAKALIDKGELGTVNDICTHMEFCYGADPAEAKTWRCANPDEVGGPIGDVASHCMYVAEFLLGSPIVEVACVYLPKQLKIKVEDGAYLKYKLKNGMAGSAKVAFSEPRGGLAGTLTNLGYEVYGDKKVMRGFGTMFQLSGYDDEPIAVRLELDDGKKVKAVSAGKVKNIYQETIKEHAKSILDKKPMCGCDAAHNLELVLAAHKSAQNGGKAVKVK